MKKHYYLLLFAILCFAGRAIAQPHCYSDEMRKRMIADHPDLIKIEADYEQQLNNALKKIDFSKVARTTNVIDETDSLNFWYDIPIVIHIIHDYGAEYFSDDVIFNDVAQWNIVYAKQNADTTDVIAPYKGNIPNSHTRYIGNPHIRLHLATRDPNGNPTKGITRHRSYMTYYGEEQAKFDDWAPTSYVNIWFINKMAGVNNQAAAYAHLPPDVTYIPFYDGVLSRYDYANTDKTINHELGHVFNLYHPWGATNNPAVACGDDNVDDTPPTKGHAEGGCQYTVSSNPNSINDTACATNYFKIYTSAAGGDSLVNYPDTTNAQNIMDYTYCSRMFTAGQVARMHTALNSTVGGRNNLWDSTNLQHTGVLDASNNLITRLDLKPIPDYAIIKSSNNYMDRVNYFTFPNINVNFYNESYNDTITTLAWTFSNGATIPTSAVKTFVTNSFATPGWVTLSMKATGNNTGDSTVTWPRALFVADLAGTPGQNIMQQFSGSDTAKWPFFNYYNNEFKWQIANTGLNDNYSLEYVGFDNRIVPGLAYPNIGAPQGDFDDFFSIPVDLSAYTAGHCSLNFDYSGASRSSSSMDINDTLAIDYTINNGTTWNKVTILSKGNLDNMGAISVAYAPLSSADWSHMSIDIPAAAITPYTTFRFRYKPNVAGPDNYGNSSTLSSGNNYYMDNIGFSSFPASVGNVELHNTDIAVVPNPTSGDAFVVIKDVANTSIKIIVTDITGKVVYTTTCQYITGNQAQIEIPQSAISVKGMYIVQAITGAKSYTQKLVVY